MSKRGNDDRDRYPFGRGEDPDDALGGVGDTPIDLAAVQADDEFLSMLGQPDAPITNETDAELAKVLVAWRREVDSEPSGELVSTPTALKVLESARRRRAPRRHPVLAPFAAAAAVLVIAFSAVGLVAKSAKPGDQLFTLTEVLYADYASSMRAAYQVQSDLEQARIAFEQGRTDEAKVSLDRAEAQLEEIAPDTDERTDLTATYQELRAKVGDSPGSGEPATPGDPGPGDPTEVPVPPSESPTVEPSEPKETAPPVNPSPSPTPPSSPVPADPDPDPPEPTPRSAAPDGDPGDDLGPSPGLGPDPNLPSPSVPTGP